jgi:hypothetical protein
MYGVQKEEMETIADRLAGGERKRAQKKKRDSNKMIQKFVTRNVCKH